jgi:hypothetical protein
MKQGRILEAIIAEKGMNADLSILSLLQTQAELHRELKRSSNLIEQTVSFVVKSNQLTQVSRLT